MRAEDVPTARRALLDGQTKLVYALGSDGRYRGVSSGGEEAEAAALEEAVAWFDQRAAQVRERMLRGEASTLEYLMWRQRMDVATLAQATGIWRWRVRRHLQLRHFARLSPLLVARYAGALGVDESELRTPPA